ncbi:hypothetical protein FRC10_009698 [Ceratobasidium sp. 414]|nr:hypothetical protein FRC10_009698 [Ceratobasidium sp. 414]
MAFKTLKNLLGDKDRSQNLIIVGIVSGAISILILVGLALYVVVRQRRRRQHPRSNRHRHSVPATSQILNRYSRARTESGVTDGSGSKSTRNEPTVEPKRGYFKSWSKSTKVAYLSVPTGINDSYNQLVLESSEAVYRYDPDAAISLPKRKRRKSSYSRLGLLAPSPKIKMPSRPPLAETTNKPSPPIPQQQPEPEPPRPSRAIRPRAELLMARPSLDTRLHALRRQGGVAGTTGLGSFIPPPPPSWASVWPTESGFTGFEGDPSIRDEDFGDESDGEWVSDGGKGKRKGKWREDGEESGTEGERNMGFKVVLEREASVRTDESSDDDEGQYALDTRPAEHISGPFRLTPRELQGRGRTSFEVDPIAEGGSVTTVSPRPSPRPEARSPQLDLGDSGDSEPAGSVHSVDRPADLQRSVTGRFTMAFGKSARSRSPSGKVSVPGSGRVTRSSTAGSARGSSKSRRSNRTGTDRSSSNYSRRPAPGHSRNDSAALVRRSDTAATRSSIGVTRSNTMRTDTTESSTASGQILAALTGRFATPLLRSVQSLRRVADAYVDSDAVSSSAALPSALPSAGSETPAPPPYASPIRRLPPIPSSSSPPPVPSIPQHYLGMPIAAQPRVPENVTAEAPTHQNILRSTSLTLPDPRALPSRPNNMPHATIPRSVSLGTGRRIRPLPVPPLPSSGREFISSGFRS